MTTFPVSYRAGAPMGFWWWHAGSEGTLGA